MFIRVEFIVMNFKEGVSLHSQPRVRFRDYFEYFLREKSLKNLVSSGTRLEHSFYILIRTI